MLRTSGVDASSGDEVWEAAPVPARIRRREGRHLHRSPGQAARGHPRSAGGTRRPRTGRTGVFRWVTDIVDDDRPRRRCGTPSGWLKLAAEGRCCGAHCTEPQAATASCRSGSGGRDDPRCGTGRPAPSDLVVPGVDEPAHRLARATSVGWVYGSRRWRSPPPPRKNRGPGVISAPCRSAAISPAGSRTAGRQLGPTGTSPPGGLGTRPVRQGRSARDRRGGGPAASATAARCSASQGALGIAQDVGQHQLLEDR